MKKQKAKTVLSLVVTFTAIFIFTLNVTAQCVKCVPAPPGWICQAADLGGEACAPDGTNCTLINTCSKGSGDQPEGNSSKNACSPKILDNPQVTISDGIVRDIGKLNPNVAIALISIRNIRVEFTEGKIFSAPIGLTEQDVENHLVLPKSAKYFQKLKERVSLVFKEKNEPIGYDFFLTEDKSANSFVLNLKPIKSEMFLSSFKITLTKVSTFKGNSEIVSFNADSWQIN